MVRIRLPGYVVVQQCKIHGAATAASATAATTLPPGKHGGVEDDTKPDGAVNGYGTDDGPSRTDANVPAHTYCLFGVNELFDTISSVLPHKLAQTRHLTLQWHTKMLFFILLRAHIFISPDFLSKTAVLKCNRSLFR